MNPPSGANRADLDSGLELAARAVSAGSSSPQAIDAALQHIRSRQALSMLDEARIRDWLERELPQATRPTRPAPEPEANPATEIPDAARQLYRMTGPTRFSPVGKPPFIFPPLWLYRLIDGRTSRQLSPDCLKRRQIILLSAALACLLAGVFPPWIQTVDLNTTHTQSDAGYAFILTPPAPREYSYAIGIRLDHSRLRLEAGCLLAATLAAWFLFGREKKGDRKP